MDENVSLSRFPVELLGLSKLQSRTCPPTSSKNTDYTRFHHFHSADSYIFASIHFFLPPSTAFAFLRLTSLIPTLKRASASLNMEIFPGQQEHDHDQAAIAPSHEDRGLRQYKGIRERKWGRWVSEIRRPRSREKIWLGSYKYPEQAARAYDAALYCLRGPKAKLNFPNSVPNIPSASSLSPKQIQHAALRYALGQTPSTQPSPNNNIEETASPTQLSSLSGTELATDRQQILEERQDSALWMSLFAASDGPELPNLEKIPSMDDVSTLDFNRLSLEQPQESYISTDLWNFQDV